jgi:hypothetical protein
MDKSLNKYFNEAKSKLNIESPLNEADTREILDKSDEYLLRLQYYKRIIPKASFVKGRLFTGIVTGLCSVAATILVFALSDYPNSLNTKYIQSKNNTLISENIEKSNYEANQLINSNLSETVNKVKQNRETSQSESPFNKIGMKPKDHNQLLFSKNEKILNNEMNLSKSSYYLNGQNNSLKKKTNNIEPALFNAIQNSDLILSDDKDYNSRSSAVINSFPGGSFPKGNIDPDGLNNFNNKDLGMFYKLSDLFSIGTDLNHETFFLKFTSLEPDSIEYIYTTRPNITTYNLDSKYYPIKVGMFAPLGQILIGMRKIVIEQYIIRYNNSSINTIDGKNEK